jgi:hypothetical protein
MRLLGRRSPARRERERTRENGGGAKTESDEEILPADLAAHQGAEVDDCLDLIDNTHVQGESLV